MIKRFTRDNYSLMLCIEDSTCNPYTFTVNVSFYDRCRNVVIFKSSENMYTCDLSDHTCEIAEIEYTEDGMQIIETGRLAHVANIVKGWTW